MPDDRKSQLDEIARDLRDLRHKLENLNDAPFDIRLGKLSVLLAEVTDLLRQYAADPLPATTHHFGANA